MAEQRLVALRLKALRAANPPERVDLLRRVERMTDTDGLRAEAIRGLVPAHALPAIDPTQTAAPEGSGFDTLADYLASLGLAFLPIANPAFTGTLSGPDVTLTGTLTVVTEVVTGHLNAGNSASDELRVYNLIGQGAAPSFANGGALGTSPGAQTVVGHDISGVILQNTGTGPTNGTLWTVTFASAKANSNYRVHLNARGASGAALQLYSTSQTTGGFVIGCGAAPAASTQIAVAWAVFGP